MWIIPYTFNFTFKIIIPKHLLYYCDQLCLSVVLMRQFFFVPTMKLMDKKIGLIFMLKKYVMD